MRRLTGVVFGMVLAACGGSHDKPKVKLSAETSGPSFCGQMANVVCYNMFECCTGAQIEKVLGIKITTTEVDCRRDAELICEATYYRQLDSLARGTVTLSNEAATDCFNALLAESDRCFLYATTIPWDDACKAPFFVGQVQPGDGCIDSYECEKDSYCAPDKRCKAYAGDGQPCVASLCASGLHCDYKTQKCAALARENQPCTSTGDCGLNLYCEPKAVSSTTYPTGEGTCRWKRDVGQPCTSSGNCISGTCIPGLCVGLTIGTADKACYKDTDCGSSTCETTGYSCTRDQDCGGTCDNTGYSCTTDSSCYSSGSSSTGKCVFKKCVAGAVCQGQPVCGESHTKVDFCAGSSAVLTAGQSSATADTTSK
jgi:hypothetical protein